MHGSFSPALTTGTARASTFFNDGGIPADNVKAIRVTGVSLVLHKPSHCMCGKFVIRTTSTSDSRLHSRSEAISRRLLAHSTDAELVGNPKFLHQLASAESKDHYPTSIRAKATITESTDGLTGLSSYVKLHPAALRCPSVKPQAAGKGSGNAYLLRHEPVKHCWPGFATLSCPSVVLRRFQTLQAAATGTAALASPQTKTRQSPSELNHGGDEQGVEIVIPGSRLTEHRTLARVVGFKSFKSRWDKSLKGTLEESFEQESGNAVSNGAEVHEHPLRVTDSLESERIPDRALSVTPAKNGETALFTDLSFEGRDSRRHSEAEQLVETKGRACAVGEAAGEWGSGEGGTILDIDTSESFSGICTATVQPKAAEDFPSQRSRPRETEEISDLGVAPQSGATSVAAIAVATSRVKNDSSIETGLRDLSQGQGEAVQGRKRHVDTPSGSGDRHKVHPGSQPAQGQQPRPGSKSSAEGLSLAAGQATGSVNHVTVSASDNSPVGERKDRNQGRRALSKPVSKRDRKYDPGLAVYGALAAAATSAGSISQRQAAVIAILEAVPAGEDVISLNNVCSLLLRLAQRPQQNWQVALQIFQWQQDHQLKPRRLGQEDRALEVLVQMLGKAGAVETAEELFKQQQQRRRLHLQQHHQQQQQQQDAKPSEQPSHKAAFQKPTSQEVGSQEQLGPRQEHGMHEEKQHQRQQQQEQVKIFHPYLSRRQREVDQQHQQQRLHSQQQHREEQQRQHHQEQQQLHRHQQPKQQQQQQMMQQQQQQQQQQLLQQQQRQAHNPEKPSPTLTSSAAPHLGEGVGLGPRVFNAIMLVLVQNRRFNEALVLFEELVLQRATAGGCEKGPTRESYNIALSALAKNGDESSWPKMEDLLQRLKLEDDLGGPDIFSFNTILGSSCVNPQRAETVMMAMQAAGVRPDAVTYNAVMAVYARAGDLSGSLNVLGRMEASRVLPTSITFNQLLHQHIQNGFYSTAWVLYEQMKQRGVQPDAFTYSTLLSGCVKSSQEAHYKKAVNLYRSLQEGDKQGRHKCPPNLHVFNAMISLHGKRGDVRAMTCVVEDMLRSRCAPSIVTFNSLLHGYGVAGSHSEVVRTLEWMQSRGCVYQERTYQALIEAYGRCGTVEEVAGVFAEMQRAGRTPSGSIYCTLMTAYGRLGAWEMAERTVVAMRSCHLSPAFEEDGRALAGLMQAYANEREGERLRECETDLRARGELRSPQAGDPRSMSDASMVLHQTLVLAFCRTDDVANAERAMEEMQILVRLREIDESAEAAPPLVIWNALLALYARLGGLQKLSLLLKQMKKAGVQPDVATYNTLIGAYGRQGMTARAQEYLQAIEDVGLRPDSISYNSLLLAYCKQGQMEDAWRVLADIRGAGMQASEATRRTLQAFYGLDQEHLSMLLGGEQAGEMSVRRRAKVRQRKRRKEEIDEYSNTGSSSSSSRNEGEGLPSDERFSLDEGLPLDDLNSRSSRSCSSKSSDGSRGSKRSNEGKRVVLGKGLSLDEAFSLDEESSSNDSTAGSSTSSSGSKSEGD
eukprot:TRINITY_DN630_c0_g9_i1.p1 TRINITY_DN630_c0_g9~~TRINITY_DN630_c0_g9_i1.p1  ORF type:complete len:1529 (-),score=317.78 TRINITY_DN630_c0_g9_i1:652-5238(-)